MNKLRASCSSGQLPREQQEPKMNEFELGLLPNSTCESVVVYQNLGGEKLTCSLHHTHHAIHWAAKRLWIFQFRVEPIPYPGISVGQGERLWAQDAQGRVYERGTSWYGPESWVRLDDEARFEARPWGEMQLDPAGVVLSESTMIR
jgi:hypothetical protein